MIYKKHECGIYDINDLMRLPTTSVVFCVRHIMGDNYEQCLLFNDIDNVTVPVFCWRLAFAHTSELALGSIQRNTIFAVNVRHTLSHEAKFWGGGCLNTAIKILSRVRMRNSTPTADDYDKYRAARDNILDNHILQVVQKF